MEQLSLWGTDPTLYHRFKKYMVTNVDTLEEFLNRYYRGDRLDGRGEGYVDAILESHRKDLEKYGYDIIAKPESVTGDVVAFYPPEVR